jgi:8-amino-7-oxononanoate synthase
MPPVQIERSAAPIARVGGREVEVFAGCDYLGLAHAPEVHEALRRGIERYGISAGGSRATTGNTAAHDALEHDLARFLGLEAALLVPDGYLSSLVFAQGVARHRPRVLVDREAHVSTRDALAASGLEASAYSCCDAGSAATERARLDGRVLVMTDGVYPVLRGIAPLAQLLALVPSDGWLAVDDAHGTGVLGARGRGTHEHHGVVDPRLVVTGTLSKALGCFGGFVAGTRAVVDEVAAHSHALVGSTPIPPALASAASAAVELLERDPSRLARLRANIALVRRALRDAGLDVHDLPVPVFAWKTDSSRADSALAVFARHHILVPHVRYPDGLGSYFRLAVSAAHGENSIGRLAAALREVMETP